MIIDIIIKKEYVLFPLIAICGLHYKILAIKGNDFKKQSPIINYILKTVFSSEEKLLPYLNLPFGMSIFIVCQKKDEYLIYIYRIYLI